MTSEADLIPAYLQSLLASNAEGQVTDNTPFQGFAAPSDSLVLTDAVSFQTQAGNDVYGSRVYGAFKYGQGS